MPTKPPPERTHLTRDEAHGLYASPPPPQRHRPSTIPLGTLLLEAGPFLFVALAVGMLIGRYAGL